MGQVSRRKLRFHLQQAHSETGSQTVVKQAETERGSAVRAAYKGGQQGVGGLVWVGEDGSW